MQITPSRVIGWSLAIIIGCVAWFALMTGAVFAYQIAQGL